VASRLQSKLARVSRMDWEELRVRVGQELHKRADLLMYRMGVNDRAPALNGASTRSGPFFFPTGKGLECADLLHKYLPEDVSKILREADEICDHRFRLLGYENLEFVLDGRRENIDWHLDPVHGKRGPLDPWFKIPFLDFAVVGDHKITWELNRHQHLVTLAKARLLSGDEKYAVELIAQWHSWIKANPYPLGINWGSTLEVAFRSLSWIWVDQLLAGNAECAEFRAELMPALAFHGRYIARYLSTYFSPNTHLLGEAVALFFLGTLYPQLPGAAHWKASGWNILLREADRQVRPDGVYFEQSLHYHVYALDFFLHARLLAANNNVEIPPSFDAVLARMLDVIAALSQAGTAEGFGDDDGGRLWNPRRNQTEQMTDPLALGAVMYSKEFPAAQLTEEAIWLFGSEAIEQLALAENLQMDANVQSHAFPDGGLYVFADSKPYPQVMMLDAGPQGVGRSGHGHADALSLRLAMDGRRWLVDSGSGVYISNERVERDSFRGTGAHNTLRVDGLDQAVPDQPFSWTNIPTVQAETWIAGKTFTYFVGSHNGYARLADPVEHRRHVMRIAGGIYLVRDVVLGRAKHELEIRWHFAPDLKVRVVGKGRVEASTQSGESALVLITPRDTAWSTEVSITRLSHAYGAYRPAPMVRSYASALLPAETATAFESSKNETPEEDRGRIESQLVGITQSGVQTYTFESRHRDETQEFFFALADAQWSSGPWTSDARVLYCRNDREKLAQLVVIGGTYLHWQGQPLLTQPLLTMSGSSAFFEWDHQNATMNARPGDFSVTPLLEGLATGGEPSASKLSKAPANGNRSTYAEKH
jgi:hypothetical protein